MRKVAGAKVKEGTNCIQITNIEKIITCSRSHTRQERKKRKKYIQSLSFAQK